MGAPAPGYSSGQAIKAIEEVMKTMPSEVGYEWSGLTLQEKKSEGQAPIIFGMAVLFVFLLLAAQYESWGLPFAVLLATPTVILGLMIGMLVRHFDLNVYAQIGLVMLIGLAGQERHPHRRVRQDETRGRRRDSRCGRRRLAAAPAADPDDVLRLHSRLRAADAGHRFRRRVAQHHGHGRGVWHDHRHGRSACSSSRSATCSCSKSSSAAGRRRPHPRPPPSRRWRRERTKSPDHRAEATGEVPEKY